LLQHEHGDFDEALKLQVVGHKQVALSVDGDCDLQRVRQREPVTRSKLGRERSGRCAEWHKPDAAPVHDQGDERIRECAIARHQRLY
jgi:hypothetical protein